MFVPLLPSDYNRSSPETKLLPVASSTRNMPPLEFLMRQVITKILWGGKLDAGMQGCELHLETPGHAQKPPTNVGTVLLPL